MEVRAGDATGSFTVLAEDGDVAPARRARPRRREGLARERTARGRRAPPRLWSAEEPALYTLELERRRRDGLDARSASATVEIRDRQLLVNGEPVLIAGVNRHEHDDTPRPRASRAS